jgi:hypothetical protein
MSHVVDRRLTDDDSRVRYTVTNERKNGLHEEWYNNGKLRKRMTFVDGVKHGKYVECYKSGWLRQRHTYVHGFIHGEYQEFARTGSTTVRCSYVHGRFHGLYEYRHPKQNHRRMGFYIGGLRHGIWTFNEFPGAYDELYGTVSWTRGREITKEEHDAEMRLNEGRTWYVPKHEVRSAYAWLIVAKRLSVCRDVARKIVTFAFRSVEEVYYYRWLEGQRGWF